MGVGRVRFVQLQLQLHRGKVVEGEGGGLQEGGERGIQSVIILSAP